MRPPSLYTTRLQLRLIEPTDAAFILRGLSDKRVTAYYAVHYDTPEAVQEQMQFYQNLLQEGSGAWWAFSRNGDSELMGACGLSSVSQEHRKGELGFWLLPEHWGNGYIPEAAGAILKYGFEQLGQHRIEAIVEGGNAPSERVLQKLGFAYEGKLRECELKHHRFIDLLYYSLLETDLSSPAKTEARQV